ncbi:MAG: putative Membrane protein, partial [Acidimicrobiales bacterium]|nr:putative Membrane protein [Acidimicrobiales bacterium]
LGNQYYAAAARSMGGSWHAFFFASFDPGGYISVDKPPVALWASALSARMFGYGPWSLLLPSALAGAGSVALLWTTVRRTSGPVAATVAGAVLALSPVNVAVNRLNLPEPFLVLSLVAAAWAVVRSFDSRHAGRWVVLAGVFVGIGFNVKMLAADVAVPALGLAILVGTSGRWWPRVRNGAAFGVAALVASTPWIVAVALTPAAQRPWVGGSTNDSVTDLVFGYNGLGRVNGAERHGHPAASAAHAAHAAPPGRALGGIIAGVPGPGRFFGSALAAQVGWLLPLAVAGAVLAVWHHRREGRGLGAVVLWAGWLATYAVVFSAAEGIFHAYYTSVMVPALAAVVGMGAGSAASWLGARPRVGSTVGEAIALAAGAAGLALTIAWQAHIVGFVRGYFAWTVPLSAGLLALGIVAAAGVVLARGAGPLSARATGLIAAVALGATLVTPTAWASSQADHPVRNTTLPQAGPRIGPASRSFGSPASDGDAPLARYLVAHRDRERWDLATANARQGSGLIAYDHLSVMALGGFMGTDPTAGVAGMAQMVSRGEVRYFAPAPLSSVEHAQLFVATVDRRLGPFDPAGPVGGVLPVAHGGNTAAGRIMAAVTLACAPVHLSASVRDLPATGVDRLWDCRGRGPALAREGRYLARVRRGPT